MISFKKYILDEVYQSYSGPSHGHAYGGTGFKRREREDDEYHVPDPVAKDTPHAVHINGKKWKTFSSQSHASNVAKKIKGATVHKEEFEQIDELKSSTIDSYKDTVYKKLNDPRTAEKTRTSPQRLAGVRRANKRILAREETDEQQTQRTTEIKRFKNQAKQSKLTENVMTLKGYIVEQHTRIAHNNDHKEITHGEYFSLKIHKDHHENISNLQDGERHPFKCMDGKEWSAVRQGDKLHFVAHPDDVRIHTNYHSSIPHTHFTGETEHTEEEKPAFEGVFANGTRFEVK